MGLLLLTSAAAVIACSDSSNANEIREVRSALTREAQPAVTVADRAVFARDNAAFAIELLRLAGGPTENTLVSPYSVQTALAMAYAGAAGKTRDDVGRALHFTLPEENLHAAFNWVDLELDKRFLGETGKDGKPARLNVDNLLFSATDARLAAPFLDVLARNYGAGVRVLDFQNAPEEATRRVNGLVSERTEKRIDPLLDRPLSSGTRVVLVNTVYANAAWTQRFTPAFTRPGTFKGAAGDVSIPMMRSSADRAYASNETAEVVELALTGNAAMFDVILPKIPLADYEAALTGPALLDLLDATKSRTVDLELPKFRVEPKRGASLKDALSILGMGGAFGDEADFSRMLPNEKVRIDDVIHKTFLEIDEEGLEAAAATAVVFPDGGASLASDPVTVTVDRPFLLALRDRPTGQLLFLGHVTNPR